MKRTIEEVVEDYKTQPNSTEKQKAILEDELWALRPPGTKNRDHWVSAVLGVERTEVDKRSRFISAGDAADPIWENMEKDLSVHAAIELLLKARALSHAQKLPLDEAVRQVVGEYMSWPIAKYLPNNKVVRKPPPANTYVTRKPRSRQVVVDFSEEPAPVVDIAAVVEEKNFWVSIKKQFSTYIDKRLEGFDGIERADIKRTCEHELRTVLESLRVKLHLKASRRKARISFSEVEDACETLVMDCPRRGALPDMDLAKKRKRVLAKEYHSDLSGTGATNENLTAVLEAYTLLETFCAQMQQSVAQGQNTQGEGNTYHGGSNG